MNKHPDTLPKERRLVSVVEDLGQIDAQFLRMYLREHGIEVSIPGLAHRQSLSDIYGSQIGLRVLVPEEHSELARELVANWHELRKQAASDADNHEAEAQDDDSDLAPAQREARQLARQQAQALVDRQAYCNRAIALMLSIAMPIGAVDIYFGRYTAALTTLFLQAVFASLLLRNLSVGLAALAAHTIYQALAAQQRITSARRAVATRRNPVGGGPYREMYAKT